MYVLSAHYWEQAVPTTPYHHDWHQMIFITQGAVQVTVRGESVRAEAGDLIILGRFEEHSLRALSPDYKRYILCIAADTARRTESDRLLSVLFTNRADRFRRVLPTADHAPHLQTLFAAIVSECTNRAPYGEVMADLLFQQVLITLYRAAPSLFREAEHRNTELIDVVRRRLERDYAEKITLASLAEGAHVSPSHLSHLFRAITGISPIAYLHTVRLSEAKRLLETTDLSVQEIVYRCGFSDESNFARTFRRRTGLTPVEYRRRTRRS